RPRSSPYSRLNSRGFRGHPDHLRLTSLITRTYHSDISFSKQLFEAARRAEDAVIETQELTRTFGGTTAVDRLTLTVEEGEVFGLLGPNGAGTTTTVRI